LSTATILLSSVLLLVVTSGHACAQTPSPDSSTILITLGTAGGPVPRKDRMQSSNLLVVNDTLYLIDAGGGVTHRLVEAGYDYRQAGKIFITHAHSDHTAGLALHFWFRNGSSRRRRSTFMAAASKPW
jgi:ribonuclease BN (tRNA processing enzyme)